MARTEFYLSKFVSLLLKLSVIAYLFAVVFPFISDPGFESTIAAWSLRWVLITLIAIIALGVFLVNRSQFYAIGFFLVAIAAVYQLFVVLLSSNLIVEVLLHFYALSTAIYFLTRDLRHQGYYKKHRAKRSTDNR
jgi:hypothetical protein